MDQLHIEREHHNKFYDSKIPLEFIDVNMVHKYWLQPCYTTGSDQYSDNRMEFIKIINKDGGWKGKHVLDYACGPGQWSIYFALTGAKAVNGFDISDKAIRRGKERAEAQGLKQKIRLDVMNATKLDYSDSIFDIVIGVGVIHHVIKYPGIFEEIFRVMKPGSKAYFLENLADFPLFRFLWKIKGKVPQGDVPIFSKDIFAMTKMFSDTKVIGDNFVYSVKKILGNNNPGKLRKFVLKISKKIDDTLFSFYPPFKKWGCMCYIILKK